MGVDLRGAGGLFHFNWTAWSNCLNLGLQYGWEPAGTVIAAVTAPDGTVLEEGCSDASYMSNDYQQVTTEDAGNLAAALEKALADVPDHEALEDHKQHLRDFVAYCREGGFLIG